MADISPSAQKNWLRRPRFWLSIVVSLLALYLAVRDVQWSEVATALSKANGILLLLALVSVLLNTLGKAVRWRLLFYPRHTRLSVKNCLSVLFVGQLTNSLLPARSGDLVRALLIAADRNTSRVLALATVAVEKAMDSVLLLLLVVLLSVRMPMPRWLRRSSLVFGGALVVLLLAVMIIASQRQRIVGILESWIGRYPRLAFLRLLARLAEASGELGALRNIRVQTQLWTVSIVIWGLAIATNTLVFWAAGLDVDALASPLLLVVLMAGAILPTSPLQLGVFHYLCVLTLSLFGVGQSVALSYAVLLHLVVYLPIVLGGVLGLWVENPIWPGVEADE